LVPHTGCAVFRAMRPTERHGGGHESPGTHGTRSIRARIRAQRPRAGRGFSALTTHRSSGESGRCQCPVGTNAPGVLSPADSNQRPLACQAFPPEGCATSAGGRAKARSYTVTSWPALQGHDEHLIASLAVRALSSCPLPHHRSVPTASFRPRLASVGSSM